MKINRRILNVFWVLLFIPALTGCPRDEPVSKANVLPFAGQEVRIGVPADRGFRTEWEGPLNEWAAQSGARYILNEYGPRDAFSGFSGPASCTFAIFPLEQVGETIGSGELVAIPTSVIEGAENAVQWQDLFAGLREKLASTKRQPLFVPLSAPVLVCYFRQDLLNAAGLEAPQTWHDYQQLLDNLASWAPGCTAVEPWSEAFCATMFLARAVLLAQHPGQYSLFFDIGSGAPLIDSPGFVRALEAARDALKRMPAAVRNYNPSDCRKELLQGRAALAIAYEAPAGSLPQATAPAGDRPGPIEIGFIRLPGSREVYNTDRRIWEPLADKSINRVTLTAFSGWAVGASARNSALQTEASWNALVKICGSELTSGFPSGIVGLCRESQLHNPGIFEAGLESREATAYASAVAQSLRDTHIVAELPLKGRLQFRQALARALADAIDGSKTSAHALEAAAHDWREIIEQLGSTKVRDGYRASLGLNPKQPHE